MDKSKFSFKKLTKNKCFLPVVIPSAALIIAGIVLLIVAPWQSPPPPVDSGETVVATPLPTASPPPEVIADTPEPTPEPTPTPTPRPPHYDGPTNPLTGEPMEEDISAYRPWAVSIGNVNGMLPQRGIGQADMLVEFRIEAGETRFLAFYQDVSEVSAIGGLRSLRTSSMYFSGGFDAIFVHWMGRTYENDEITGNPVSRLGTIDAAAIGYTEEGTKPIEFRRMISGRTLIRRLPESFRTELAEGFEQTLLFQFDGTPAGGKTAEEIKVLFTSDSNKSTTFTYDEEDGKYYVRQHGRTLTDANDNKRVGFTNVLIMNMDVRPGWNLLGHTFIEPLGEGAGFFACGGKYVEITWKRDMDLAEPYYYYFKNGEPLELGVGTTFICLIDDDMTPEIN